jgi:predicted deacylase
MDTKPGDINGTLVIVPVANTVAFDERVLFVNPLDEVTLYVSTRGMLRVQSHMSRRTEFSLK